MRRSRNFSCSATYGMSEDMIAAERNMHVEISAAVGTADRDARAQSDPRSARTAVPLR